MRENDRRNIRDAQQRGYEEMIDEAYCAEMNASRELNAENRELAERASLAGRELSKQRYRLIQLIRQGLLHRDSAAEALASAMAEIARRHGFRPGPLAERRRIARADIAAALGEGLDPSDL